MNSPISDEDLKALMHRIGADAYRLVGSQYILGNGKDWDYLAEVLDFHEAAQELRREGFESESQQYENIDAQFMSFRRGDVNVLITTCPQFFHDFRVAAEVCKYLANYYGPEGGVRDRKQRVAIHAIIRDGKGWDEA